MIEKKGKKGKYRYPMIIGYGFGGVRVAVNTLLATQYFIVYLTNTVLLDIAVISTIMAVSRIFDGISDVIIGHIIDNTRSEHGKARIWIRRLCIPFSVSLLMMFMVPGSWPDYLKYVYVFFAYNLFVTVFFTFITIAMSSLISLASDDMVERGKMSGADSFTSQISQTIIGAVFVKMLLVFGDDPSNAHTQRGYFFAVLIVAIILLIANIVVFFATKERSDERVEEPASAGYTNLWEDIRLLFKNKYWVLMLIAASLSFAGMAFYLSACSYYAIYILNDYEMMSVISLATGIPALITAFLLTVIKTPAEKSKIYIISHIVFSVGLFWVFLSGGNKLMLIIGTALYGIGKGATGATAMALIAETIEISVRETGRMLVGVGYACVNAVQKFSIGLSTALFGFIMSQSGFDASLDSQGIMQSDKVISAIKWCNCGIPIICFLSISVMFIFMFDIRKKIKA